jgi:two-component system chemotaxis sensor kinase CheA
LGASDGQEAWETLNQRGADIQLVLTDVEMPRLDGLQLARRIRGDSRWAHLPVIMLTSLASDEDIRRGEEAGATSYCIKLDRDQVLTTLRNILSPAGAGDSRGLAELSRHVGETAEAPPALSCPSQKGEKK